MTTIQLVDLDPWFAGSGRHDVARRVDEALSSSGFMMITGHGIDPELRSRARSAAREFFTLSNGVKRRYAAPAGGRGWLPPGIETAALAAGTVTPADLKESFNLGWNYETGNAAFDREWFLPNVWPDDEVPRLRNDISSYLSAVKSVAEELMRIASVALGLSEDHFAPFQRHPTNSLYLTRYPSLNALGTLQEGQFRIGPHTDFGTFTVLDREAGVGGLQIHTADDQWVDAPHDPSAFTINVGDLFERWTGDRWRAIEHRVLPPHSSAPDEELISLAFFLEADPDAIIETLPPPISRTAYPPIRWGDYLKDKLATYTSL